MSYAGRNMAEYCAEHNCDQSECQYEHEHILLLDALRALAGYRNCDGDTCPCDQCKDADSVLTRAREMGIEVKP